MDYLLGGIADCGGLGSNDADLKFTTWLASFGVMELVSFLRRTAIVCAVAYFVIMFPPIITTYPDIGPIDGKPTGQIEKSRDFLGMVPPPSDDKGPIAKIEIEWPRYLFQLAVAPAVWFLLFRRKKSALTWQPGDATSSTSVKVD